MDVITSPNLILNWTEQVMANNKNWMNCTNKSMTLKYSLCIEDDERSLDKISNWKTQVGRKPSDSHHQIRYAESIIMDGIETLKQENQSLVEKKNTMESDLSTYQELKTTSADQFNQTIAKQQEKILQYESNVYELNMMKRDYRLKISKPLY